jgi:hypothetical protein
MPSLTETLCSSATLGGDWKGAYVTAGINPA